MLEKSEKEKKQEQQQQHKLLQNYRTPTSKGLTVLKWLVF